jgi:hypothetical protein
LLKRGAFCKIFLGNCQLSKTYFIDSESRMLKDVTITVITVPFLTIPFSLISHIYY